MAFVTTKDGVNIYYKDWGPKEAQPIVFHHGWPLSADDWDNQMLFFLAEGYRVIAIDRRGHGRSDQVSEGHDMDHYAADASAVVESLDLHNAVHVGHSTGGGQVARYVAKYGQPQGRVAKAVLVSAVPPLMVKTETNPGGTPIEVFDGFRKALAANRAQFYLDVASGPFYGFNRDGADVSQGTIQNWWRQGMIGSAKAHYEGIKAFSETDQTEDLKTITVPVLVLQGDDDQVVPYKNAALLQDKLLANSVLKIYPASRTGCILPMRILSTRTYWPLFAHNAAFLAGWRCAYPAYATISRSMHERHPRVALFIPLSDYPAGRERCSARWC
jgi:pimeloyl-ACP methyl ester carboxylesterase